MTDVLTTIASLDEGLDRGTAHPREGVALLREAGWLGEAVEAATAAGWEVAFARLYALGAASLTMARLYEGHLNALRLVADCGSAAQDARVAEAAREGTMLGVWGADAREPATWNGSLLHGAKAFASGLGAVDLAIVTARRPGAEGGLQMLLVDARDPARHRPEQWDVAAMVGSASGGFDCEGLAGEELGPPDAMLAEPAFHGGLWRLCAAYAGAMADIARQSAAALAARGQGEDPRQKHRLGLIAMEARGADLWARHAARSVEASGDANLGVMAALQAREAIEAAALRQRALVERALGTALFARGSALGRRLRDLSFYLRQATLDAKLDYATNLWRSE